MLGLSWGQEDFNATTMQNNLQEHLEFTVLPLQIQFMALINHFEYSHIVSCFCDMQLYYTIYITISVVLIVVMYFGAFLEINKGHLLIYLLTNVLLPAGVMIPITCLF